MRSVSVVEGREEETQVGWKGEERGGVRLE